jgi:hypothetical protein
VGTDFLGAHTPSASIKVVRCFIRHARPSQLQSDKAAWQANCSLRAATK